MINQKVSHINKLISVTIAIILVLQVSNFKIVSCEPQNNATINAVIMSDILKPSYSDNRCAINAPIRLGNTIYYKGYLIKRNSLLEGTSTIFKLEKKYRILTAQIGIASAKSGQCTVSIYGDSIPLFVQSFNEKSIPKNISLNVTNVSNLSIRLECDPFGPWIGIANPTLISATSSPSNP